MIDAKPQQPNVVEVGGALADLRHLLLDAGACPDRNADMLGVGRSAWPTAGARWRSRPRGFARAGLRAAGALRRRRGLRRRLSAACGACAAAGVRPAAARAIAHPISFIFTPVTCGWGLEHRDRAPLNSAAL